MLINEAIYFTEFSWFYDKFKPLTPYGYDLKEKYDFITDINQLRDIFDITEKTLAFINSDNQLAELLEYHLAKIDRLNSLDKESFDSIDLFLIKKILRHYQAISTHLPLELKSLLNIELVSSNLLNKLTSDHDNSESFHLSSSFSSELARIRNRINKIDIELLDLKQRTIEQYKQEHQLDFSDRDFILIKRTRLEELNEQVYYEFYDADLILVKPIYPNQYMDTLIYKEELLKVETEQEKDVLLKLSEAVVIEKHNLLKYINDVGQLDTFMARARIAINLKLSKPELNNGLSMKIVDGVYLPLKENNVKLGMQYTPLTTYFESNAIMLSGSNMGGKTVLFKTIGFLQLIAQMGFWTPASYFETRLFDEIHVLGTTSNELNVEGLSSFGQEIFKLSNVMNDSNKTKLLLADELAKTTNASEAKAILYGVLQHVSNSKNITGYFSTHFINMPLIKGVLKLKIKGLNHSILKSYYKKNNTLNITEKIKLINSFMQYEVEKDKGENKHADALVIAKMLGLHKDIINYANNYLDKNYDTI